MDWHNNIDQFFGQLSDLQRGFLNSWSSAPSMHLNSLNFTENFEKTLRFQEEVVKKSLELQALATSKSIETQKQFWDGYFNMMRQAQIKKAE